MWYIHKDGTPLHIQGKDLRKALISIVGYERAMAQLSDWHEATLGEYSERKLYEIPICDTRRK